MTNDTQREMVRHRGAPRFRWNRSVFTQCHTPLPIHIIIAEPDDLIRDLLEGWLRDAGYDVTRCSDSASAQSSVAPKLVIADISDPARADTALAELRASYAAPILALSTRFRRGLAGSANAARLFQVAKVLPKPFTREELLTAVRDTMAT